MSINSFCKIVLLYWNLEWESYNIYIIRNIVGIFSFFMYFLSFIENWSDIVNRNCSNVMEYLSYKVFI